VGLTGQKADIRQDRSFFLGNWQVLLLNSSVPDQVGGHLSDDSLHWLARALDAHPNHHALVCLHHQPVPVGSAWIDEIGLSNGADLFAVLDRYPQVRAVLWGHVHQEFDTDRNGVRLLSTPSTCIQFAPGAEVFTLDAAGPGYRWLTLNGDGGMDTGVMRLPDAPIPVPDPGETVVEA
jgi:Icc protein